MSVMIVSSVVVCKFLSRSSKPREIQVQILHNFQDFNHVDHNKMQGAKHLMHIVVTHEFLYSSLIFFTHNENTCISWKSRAMQLIKMTLNTTGTIFSCSHLKNLQHMDSTQSLSILAGRKLE